MALIASSIGVADQGIYRNFRTVDALPAILSQDLVAVLASLGIVGYLFYIYGLYVVGKIYNILYLLYMAIFSLSFFSLVYGIANIRDAAYGGIEIPEILRKISAAFLALIPLIFYPMWILQMWPFMREMRVPIVNSNVYILDVCFLLPVFAMMAAMLLKKSGFAILLTPVLLIKGFTLAASVALTEFLKPFYALTWDAPFALLFAFLTLASLALAVVYSRKARYPTAIDT